MGWLCEWVRGKPSCLVFLLQEISGGASSTVVTTASDFVWRGMRTVAEIRREKNQAIPVNKDSLYKPIERAPRVFNPLRVNPPSPSPSPWLSLSLWLGGGAPLWFRWGALRACSAGVCERC
jgi:hypothetical protein